MNEGKLKNGKEINKYRRSIDIGSKKAKKQAQEIKERKKEIKKDYS